MYEVQCKCGRVLGCGICCSGPWGATAYYVDTDPGSESYGKVVASCPGCGRPLGAKCLTLVSPARTAAALVGEEQRG